MHHTQKSLNYSNFISYLSSIGYLNVFNKDHQSSDKISNNLNLNILTSFNIDKLEFNNKITPKEANIKYKSLMLSINELFSTQLTLDTLYKEYTKDFLSKTSFCQFINWLILLDFILTNFNENLLNFDYNELFDKKIFVYELDTFNDKLEKKYQLIYNENNKLVYIRKLDKLLIMLYLFSFCDKLIFGFDENPLETYVKICSYYNKIYCTNTSFCILFYLEILIISSIFDQINNILIKDFQINNVVYLNNKISSKGVATQSGEGGFKRLFSSGGSNSFNLNTNRNTLTTKTEAFNKINHYKTNKINSKDDSLVSFNKYNNVNQSSNIENFYLCDESGINSKIEDYSKINNDLIKIFQLQNHLKYLTFYTMSEINIKMNINLTIECIYSFINSKILSYSSITTNKNKNNSNTSTARNKEKKDELIIDSNLILNSLNFNNAYIFNLFTKENIAKTFKNYSFSSFIIIISNFKSIDEIKTILSKYENLFLTKTMNFYIQEPVVSVTNSYLPIQKIYLDWSIISYLMVIFSNRKKNEKSISLSFKLNTCKCTINCSEIKDISIYFNYSSIREREFYKYLNSINNVLTFIENQKNLLLKCDLYKPLININIRLYQNNFRLEKLNFGINVLAKYIINFIIETPCLKPVKIIDQFLGLYDPSIEVIVINSNEKKKDIVSRFKHNIGRFKYDLTCINQYLNDLVDYFDYIVICEENNKIFSRMRKITESKLIFAYLNNPDCISNKKVSNLASGAQSSKNDENNNYLNLYIFLKNDKILFDNAFNLFFDLKEKIEDSTNLNMSVSLTACCDRDFLENQIFSDTKNKLLNRIIFQICDYFYLINKEPKTKSDINITNNDFFIGEDYIGVFNFERYKKKMDINYNILISNFVSSVSMNIELITYILKKKNIYIPRFVYINRFQDEKFYSVEYTESNIFFREIKNLEPFHMYNCKYDFPLFSLLSKKHNTNFVTTSDNFYDIFIRLFLNLHKITDENNTMTSLFLGKIHKNIFFQYYDSFVPIFFSYIKYSDINTFFKESNFLTISKGDKFNNCYLIPFEKFNYKKHILFNEKNYICNKLLIIDFNFPNDYYIKYPKYFQLSIKKIDYVLDKIKNDYIPKNNENIKKSMFVLSKKVDNKKVLDIIFSFYAKHSYITYYNFNKKVYEGIFSDREKEMKKIKEQKIESRVNKLTGNVAMNDSKNNCNIY